MTKTFCDHCGAELVTRLGASLSVEMPEEPGPEPDYYLHSDLCKSCARDCIALLRKHKYLKRDPKEPSGLLSGETLGRPLGHQGK